MPARRFSVCAPIAAVRGGKGMITLRPSLRRQTQKGGRRTASP
nr:TPA_asm: m69.5 sORF 3 [Murid betaherpesvirus 1]DBA07814.1 TPA_asm: m69.5 sORF 3 [Murid betaherpesvirus 1]